ncbi:MAG: DUF4123 domain-containing protein [Oxalobacteraceae bacterium]|nr:MAG: DUF4123 domain-containing protein [Oxalobacteraceae bacterium]
MHARSRTRAQPIGGARMKREKLNLYLLIDNGLLQATSARYAEIDSQSRPSWLALIYTERALEVSPILIDLEAAYDGGDLDQVMGYVNALVPALHVSVIETQLSLAEIARHLRRFIFIFDPDGNQFTLRYADCAILTPLSTVLTDAQWSTLRGPIARWCAHDRSGHVIELRSVPVIERAMMPLELDSDQIAALDEASEPDLYIAKVKMMRHGEELPGTTAEQHCWASKACQAWRASKNPSHLYLLFLTEAAVLSRGKVLRRPEILAYLLTDDINTFKEKMRKISNNK